MKVDQEKIKTVLAMFDPEDIPYINTRKKHKLVVYNNNKDKVFQKVIVKRVGESRNDGQR